MKLLRRRKDRVELYRDRAGNWRWRYMAENGNILADSGQGYVRHLDCVTGAKRVTRSVLSRPALVFTVEHPEGQ